MKKTKATRKFNGKIYKLMGQTTGTKTAGNKMAANLKKSGYKKVRMVLVPASSGRPKLYLLYARKS